MNAYRIRTFLLILAVIVVSAVPFPSYADSDSNDSLDNPELLAEGSVSGHVEDHYTGDYPNMTHHEDNDIYRIPIPPGYECEIRLKNTEEETTDIRGIGYDHDKVELHYSFSLYVTIPGEVDINTWKNEKETSQNIYVLICGEGNYTLCVSFTDIIEEEEDEEIQYHQYYDRPQIVEDGIYSNTLPIEDGILDIEKWYYRVSVKGWHYLRVSFEKLNDDTGTLYLRSMDPNFELTTYDTIDIVVDRRGENLTGEWFNSKSRDDDILLKVQGKGHYKLIIDTKSGGSMLDDPAFAVLMGTLVFSVCALVVLIMVPVTIIIILAIALIRHSRKKKRDK